MIVRMQNGPAGVGHEAVVVSDDPAVDRVCPATRSVGGGCHGYDDLRCVRDAGHCGKHRAADGSEWDNEKGC